MAKVIKISNGNAAPCYRVVEEIGGGLGAFVFWWMWLGAENSKCRYLPLVPCSNCKSHLLPPFLWGKKKRCSEEELDLLGLCCAPPHGVRKQPVSLPARRQLFSCLALQNKAGAQRRYKAGLIPLPTILPHCLPTEEKQALSA